MSYLKILKSIYLSEELLNGEVRSEGGILIGSP